MQWSYLYLEERRINDKRYLWTINKAGIHVFS